VDFTTAKAKLITELGSRIKNARVIEAMARVPREHFVPFEKQSLAYEDTALPIGFNQTISQPDIVAVMTQALELDGNLKVLEVGTGSYSPFGYVLKLPIAEDIRRHPPVFRESKKWERLYKMRTAVE